MSRVFSESKPEVFHPLYFITGIKRGNLPTKTTNKISHLLRLPSNSNINQLMHNISLLCPRRGGKKISTPHEEKSRAR